jgi:hypothetical protein
VCFVCRGERYDGTKGTDWRTCRQIPSTPWAKDKRLKEIGLYQQQNMLDSSTSYGYAHFTRVLGWTGEEYSVLAAQVKNEFRNPKSHLYSW